MFKVGLSHNFRFLICHDIFPVFGVKTLPIIDLTEQYCTTCSGSPVTQVTRLGAGYSYHCLSLRNGACWRFVMSPRWGSFEVGPNTHYTNTHYTNTQCTNTQCTPIASVPTMLSQAFPQPGGESSPVTSVAQGAFLLLIFSSLDGKTINIIIREVKYSLDFWMFIHHPSKFGKFLLKFGREIICQS